MNVEKELMDSIVEYTIERFQDNAVITYYKHCEFMLENVSKDRTAVYEKKLDNLYEAYDRLYDNFLKKYSVARNMVCLFGLKQVKLFTLNRVHEGYRLIGIRKVKMKGDK